MRCHQRNQALVLTECATENFTPFCCEDRMQVWSTALPRQSNLCRCGRFRALQAQQQDVSQRLHEGPDMVEKL